MKAHTYAPDVVIDARNITTVFGDRAWNTQERDSERVAMNLAMYYRDQCEDSVMDVAHTPLFARQHQIVWG